MQTHFRPMSTGIPITMGVPITTSDPRHMRAAPYSRCCAVLCSLSHTRPNVYPSVYERNRKKKPEPSNPYIHNLHDHNSHIKTSPRSPPQANPSPLSIIRKDLVRHDHDPQQEYGADEPQGKHGLPALADAALLQPGEGLEGLARGVAVEDGGVAVGRDAARGPPELDARDDEPDEPQHEEHEAADHDDGGEEAPLEDEP